MAADAVWAILAVLGVGGSRDRTLLRFKNCTGDSNHKCTHVCGGEEGMLLFFFFSVLHSTPIDPQATRGRLPETSLRVQPKTDADVFIKAVMAAQRPFNAQRSSSERRCGLGRSQSAR